MFAVFLGTYYLGGKMPVKMGRIVRVDTNNNNNNNNNNSYDNVYGAVVMTKVIARVHPVHLMNAD